MLQQGPETEIAFLAVTAWQIKQHNLSKYSDSRHDLKWIFEIMS